MKPCNKIKREILFQAAKDYNINFLLETDEQVETAYQKLIDVADIGEYEHEFRQGEVKTNLPADYSRHYESKSVAKKMSDGTWVGWTYWYGGGKHGDPESIEWMEDAYDLNCVEEEKLVLVRTFTKI